MSRNSTGRRSEACASAPRMAMTQSREASSTLPTAAVSRKACSSSVMERPSSRLTARRRWKGESAAQRRRSQPATAGGMRRNSQAAPCAAAGTSERSSASSHNSLMRRAIATPWLPRAGGPSGWTSVARCVGATAWRALSARRGREQGVSAQGRVRKVPMAAGSVGAAGQGKKRRRGAAQRGAEPDAWAGREAAALSPARGARAADRGRSQRPGGRAGRRRRGRRCPRRCP
jgi:hypothetical protein